MDFQDLITHIKSEGCRVVLYRNKEYVDGNAAGTFDVTDSGPIILLATRGHRKYQKIETLLHEYGHFLQWQDGFLQILEGIVDGWDLGPKYIAGSIELTPTELRAVRNVVLSGEWDAEMRAIRAAKELGVKDFKPDRYIKGAKAYIASIKWEFDNRCFLQRAPWRRHFNAKKLSEKQLFAPLTKKEKEIMSKYMPKRLFAY